ncbi:MAG: SAM-dependent DNA methyltransferase [Holophagales bacterium]|nr:SAM-dependent DNA methyltransferase [Holophagales bacterium]
MTGPLPPELRKQLEKAVRAARAEGEAGARAALGALAVDAARPHESMSADERGLRRRLRAHGRQLGDARDRQSGVQEIGRLAHEVAYEHWHRMLFARFLAENGLLMEPQFRLSVSLDECRELAREAGATNGWQVAEGFAAEMLPRIFRPDDPALAVTLAPETRQRLERLVEDLPTEVFVAGDALGWTYQFWQADRKDEVSRSGAKIGADELAAVTQLFTENYMVRFLFHNTIGAWRAGKLLAGRPELAEGAASEAELAEAMRIEARNGLDGYDFEYLRFVREPSGNGDEDSTRDSPACWRPAAGTFRRWPRRAADLRVLDPCCGSGHFLVEGLELLVRLRMEEEGLETGEAVRAVLQDNLFGLEIDQRCTQIAAFNLALAAWKMLGHPVELPPLQLACTGLSVVASKGEWLKLAEGDAALEGALDRLYDLFARAPALGSLIDPGSVEKGLFQADYATAESALNRAVAREDAGDEARERAVAAQGISRAAKLLAGEYDLVITNVPFLGMKKQAATLKAFALGTHPAARADLSTTFVSRILRWIGLNGVQAVVAPQEWLFLRSYRDLRKRLLAERKWRFVARLGEHAFDSSAAAGAFAAMAVVSAEMPNHEWRMAGVDVSSQYGDKPIRAQAKAEMLRVNAEAVGLAFVLQAQHLQDPDAVVRLVDYGGNTPSLLSERASGLAGILNGDSPRFRRRIWEFDSVPSEWVRQQTSVKETTFYGGHSWVIYFDEENGHLRENVVVRRERLHDSDRRGNAAWGRFGIGVSQMRTLPVTLYSGAKFDSNLAVVLPREEDALASMWCYCSAPSYARDVRELDQKKNVTNATLVKVAFDSSRWQKVARAEYPNGLPEPYSDDPTQWLFHGHPCGSVVWDEETKWTAHGPLRTDASVLHVAVARLLGYRWPAEVDPDMRLAAETRQWVERCHDLREFADQDGIVCLQAAAGELPAAARLRGLLAAAYGEEWSPAKEQELLAAAAGGGKQSRSLDEWLRERFFAEHAKLFDKRPFVWHIWDGRTDGFHALVNCHRLCGPDGEGRRTLQALAYQHLGEWVDRQKAAQAEGEEGADARLAAAQDLQGQLGRILEGEPPCDLFIRWRPLHEQPIGWEPNLDDGVKLNIRPFVRAELQSGGRTGAGILRVQPNIKWNEKLGRRKRFRMKDGGKEPESLRPREDYPWFWSCPGQESEAERTDFVAPPGAEYDGNRWNDLHYTRAVKYKARQRAARED